MYSIKVIRKRSDLETWAPQWNTLLERSGQNNVFLTWEWVSNWLDVYVSNDALLTLVVLDGDRLVAIAPLHVEIECPVQGLSVKVLRFVGSGEACADHVDMIVAGAGPEGPAKAIWDELFGPLGAEWDVFEYYDAPADSPVVEAFRKFARSDRRCTRTEFVRHSICPYLSLPKSWDDYLKQCSGTRRYTITYSMKKLSEQGHLEKRACERPEELAEHMGTFISLHQESWVERGKPGSFASERLKRFHLRVAEDFLTRGVLFLRSFFLDGTPIASFYGFEYGGKLYYYLLGARVNPVKRVKTGTAVLGHCIEEAIAKGCREFDFLRGSEEYKYRWTSAERRNPQIRFYNRSGRALAFLVLGACHRGAKRGLKKMLGKHARSLKKLAGR